MARKTKRNGKKASAAPSRLRRVGKWLATITVWGLIGCLFLAGWFYTDLPDVEDSLATSRRPTVWVLANDGKEIAAVGDLSRHDAPLPQCASQRELTLSSV